MGSIWFRSLQPVPASVPTSGSSPTAAAAATTGSSANPQLALRQPSSVWIPRTEEGVFYSGSVGAAILRTLLHLWSRRPLLQGLPEEVGRAAATRWQRWRKTLDFLERNFHRRRLHNDHDYFRSRAYISFLQPQTLILFGLLLKNRFILTNDRMRAFFLIIISTNYRYFFVQHVSKYIGIFFVTTFCL